MQRLEKQPPQKEEKDYVGFLDSILSLPRVQYAAVVDRFGEQIFGRSKRSTGGTACSYEYQSTLEHQAALFSMMMKDHERTNGHLNYHIINWEKTIVAFMPFSSECTLVVSLNSNNLQQCDELSQIFSEIEDYRFADDTVLRNCLQTPKEEFT
jgi:hypothetical protein